MSRADLDVHFTKIDDLVTEINGQVPSGSYRADLFRADLAGLLVVAIAATYETCVKEVLSNHAYGHHAAFGDFAFRNYERLNSRIQVSDLRKYCEIFDPAISARFSATLTKRKKALFGRIGKNIETSYAQILTWRHDFAHAGKRHTTIEEAASTHMIGKRILYIFDEAFDP